MEPSQISERLDRYSLTEFQKRVLLETFKIPKGETRSYKQIAKAVGRPRAYRAVGTALRKNPLAPFVPCHRVIRSDGDLGSYSAPGGRRKKRELLKQERALQA
jgi:methylated-DNA-[protein]-cysteine S-methyltransferase